MRSKQTAFHARHLNAASSLFGIYSSPGLHGTLCILSERIIKEHPDEFGFVGVALQSSNFRQRLVFLGTDVGTCQLGSGLSLVWHIPRGFSTTNATKPQQTG